MIWIFATVVFLMLVLHPGFRALALIGAGVLGVILLIVLANDASPKKAPIWTPPAGDVLPASCTDVEASAAVKALSTNPACLLTSSQLADVNHHIAASINCGKVSGAVRKNKCVATMVDVYQKVDAAQLSKDEWSAIRCFYPDPNSQPSYPDGQLTLLPQTINTTAACVKKELHELAISKGGK
jgi:hypothetical protein